MVTGDRGAQIVDLETARVVRLGRSLETALEHGYLIIETSTVIDVPAWRRAARKAAATNGWRVRTAVTGDGSRVWAVRLDQEMTDQDRADWGATFSDTSMAAYEETRVGPMFVPWGKQLLDRVGVHEGESLLDVACGPGTVARLAAGRVGRSGSVVGRSRLSLKGWSPRTASLPLGATPHSVGTACRRRSERTRLG